MLISPIAQIRKSRRIRPKQASKGSVNSCLKIRSPPGFTPSCGRPGVSREHLVGASGRVAVSACERALAHALVGDSRRLGGKAPRSVAMCL